MEEWDKYPLQEKKKKKKQRKKERFKKKSIEAKLNNLAYVYQNADRSVSS